MNSNYINRITKGALLLAGLTLMPITAIAQTLPGGGGAPQTGTPTPTPTYIPVAISTNITKVGAATTFKVQKESTLNSGVTDVTLKINEYDLLDFPCGKGAGYQKGYTVYLNSISNPGSTPRKLLVTSSGVSAGYYDVNGAYLGDEDRNQTDLTGDHPWILGADNTTDGMSPTGKGTGVIGAIEGRYEVGLKQVNMEWIGGNNPFKSWIDAGNVVAYITQCSHSSGSGDGQTDTNNPNLLNGATRKVHDRSVGISFINYLKKVAVNNTYSPYYNISKIALIGGSSAGSTMNAIANTFLYQLGVKLNAVVADSSVRNERMMEMWDDTYTDVNGNEIRYFQKDPGFSIADQNKRRGSMFQNSVFHLDAQAKKIDSNNQYVFPPLLVVVADGDYTCAGENTPLNPRAATAGYSSTASPRETNCHYIYDSHDTNLWSNTSTSQRQLYILKDKDTHQTLGIAGDAAAYGVDHQQKIIDFLAEFTGLDDPTPTW